MHRLADLANHANAATRFRRGVTWIIRIMPSRSPQRRAHNCLVRIPTLRSIASAASRHMSSR
ncbi:hypothetical protein ACVINW_007911 [Bradyrhizobium sp. USDA 4461]